MELKFEGYLYNIFFDQRQLDLIVDGDYEQKSTFTSHRLRELDKNYLKYFDKNSSNINASKLNFASPLIDMAKSNMKIFRINMLQSTKIYGVKSLQELLEKHKYKKIKVFCKIAKVNFSTQKIHYLGWKLNVKSISIYV